MSGFKVSSLNLFHLMLFSCLLFSVPDPPVIDLSRSRVYNEGLIHWRPSEDALPSDQYLVEFRRLSGEDGEPVVWRASERVYGSSTVVSNLEFGCRYAFRVKCCRNDVFSPCGPEVIFHTPPAPGNARTHTGAVLSS